MVRTHPAIPIKSTTYDRLSGPPLPKAASPPREACGAQNVVRWFPIDKYRDAKRLLRLHTTRRKVNASIPNPGQQLRRFEVVQRRLPALPSGARLQALRISDPGSVG